MDNKEVSEIYRQARASGFQAAWMMFGVCFMFLLIIGGLIGAVCPNAAIINGLGVNSLSGYGYGCGCSCNNLA